MRRSNFTSRRAVLTFLAIVLLAEYRMLEWMAIEFKKDIFGDVKDLCSSKIMCLGLFMTATNEPYITSKDIKYFMETILNPQGNEGFFRWDLLETFEKFIGRVNYEPRSLKDLTRCKIRSCLQTSSLVPKQIKQLAIPQTLKEFILFHCEEIWDMLSSVVSVRIFVQFLS